MTRCNRRQKSRDRRSTSRHFLFQALEPRTVLSGIALTDFEPHSDHLTEHHVDADGLEYHALPPVAIAGPTDAAESAGAASGPGSLDGMTLADTFFLNSNPGASHTILLDFDGHTTSGTSWNSSFNGGANIVTPAYDTNGNTGSFADAELARIQAIWQRVAEDFLPFDVNVTTQDPGADALTKSGSGDTTWGVRVVVGGNGSWYGPYGGVAYIGSFNWSSDTPVFVFEDNLGNGNEKYTAEAISHEAGHALGLGHDGRTDPSEGYYTGHGSGETGWAPIMGVGYYKSLTQWSKGEYANASNLQDDLAIITGNNGFGYRADDHGDSISQASVLTVDQGTIVDAGIIERNTDFDVFTFLAEAGDVSINVTPFERGPNLDIEAALLDATGAVIVSANPAGSLSASLAATLSAGQYFVQITGGGQGDPLAGGYSDYGSLGFYSLSGSIVSTNAAYVSISSSTADQNEGDAGSTPLTFTVTRSGDTSLASTVSWAVAAGDTNGNDFVGGVLPEGVLTFAAGETSKTIVVEVNGDIDSESDEGFTVALSNASDGTLISTASADGIIRNDDVPPAPPGITLTPISGLTTTEAGGSASFTIVLNSAPTADVTIPLRSSDLSVGTIVQTSVTFTADNWSTPQVVMISGVDDTVRDRNVSYVIQTDAAQSADANYDELDADDVQVTNQDDEKGKGGGGTTGGGGGGGGKGGGKGKKAPAIHDSAVVEAVIEVQASDDRSDEAAIDSQPSELASQTPRIASFAAVDREFQQWMESAATDAHDSSVTERTEWGLDQLDELWSELGRL